ncbi:RcnB family protein [Sphingomonas flavalba]|uniref:RcnB family protein n=1 Tax=Sphingomonas flavalba TaxID=2559804 RepID=UPI00109DCC75|nr:RcnB family protein [Sphingomonas flavalba]
MRKLIFTALMAAVALPATSAVAQSRGELQRDRMEIQRQQQQLDNARRHGTRQDVREQRRDVRDARREYREDWQDYRRTNRNAFRRPAYAAPVRGWRYRPVTVGYSLPRAFYGQRYLIGNPGAYRLGAPRAGTRWVRYGNDVLLVNTRTGRVLTVYRDFFW